MGLNSILEDQLENVSTFGGDDNVGALDKQLLRGLGTYNTTNDSKKEQKSALN